MGHKQSLIIIIFAAALLAAVLFQSKLKKQAITTFQSESYPSKPDPASKPELAPKPALDPLPSLKNKEVKVFLELLETSQYKRALELIEIKTSKKTIYHEWFAKQRHAILLAIGWQEIKNKDCNGALTHFEESLNLKVTKLALKGIFYCMERSEDFSKVDEYCQSFFEENYDKWVLDTCVKGYEKTGSFNQGIKTISDAIKVTPAEKKSLFVALKQLQTDKLSSDNRQSETTGFFKLEIPVELEQYRSMILDELESGLQIMSFRFGLSFPMKIIRVVIYEDVKEITSKSHVPGWAGAVYDGSIRVPFHKSISLGSFESRLLHELFHALLDQQSQGYSVDVWLNEGLAQYVTCLIQECTPSYSISKNEKYLNEKLLNFNFVKSDHSSVTSAYQQSHYFIDYVSEKFSEDKVREIIEAITPKRISAEKIFKEVGLDLNEEFRNSEDLWSKTSLSQ